MGSEGETGGNQNGKLAVLVAIATIMSGFAGAYTVAKHELFAACTSIGISWCKESGSGESRESGDIGSATVDPPPPPPDPGIAISVEPRLSTDAVPAAALMQGLKGALGTVGSKASGYQIEGVVSGFANPVPRRSQFTFAWTIRRGSVAVRCKDVPVVYQSNMAGAPALFVADAIAPAIAESVKYRDVRCS